MNLFKLLVLPCLSLIFLCSVPIHFSVAQARWLFKECWYVGRLKANNSKIMISFTARHTSGVGTNFGLGGPRCIGRGGVRVI